MGKNAMHSVLIAFKGVIKIMSFPFITSDESESVIHSDDAFAPVGFLRFKKMHVEDKILDKVQES